MTKQFVTRPYRYANGVAYRPNLKTIHEYNADLGQGEVRPVGGLIELGDKFLAFAADRQASHLLQGKIGNIISEAKAYAWGATKREALDKIKPHLA